MQTPTIPHVPGLQVDEALKRLGGSARLYMKTLRMMNDALPKYLDEITEQFKAGDRESLARSFHTVKGLAGTIGAEALAEQSAQMEATAKGGMPAEAEMRDYQDTLFELMGTLCLIDFE